jgi:hypothetical protein
VRRVQQVSQFEKASSETRSSANDSDSRDNEDDEDNLRQVGPTAQVSLLDQHSKLKLEAQGTFFIIHDYIVSIYG